MYAFISFNPYCMLYFAISALLSSHLLLKQLCEVGVL